MQAQAVQPGGVLAPLMESNANYREMKNGFTRVEGSDFLGTVSVVGSPATAADRIRKVFSISPSAYKGTRLTQMADLWERFVFRKFRLRYVPSVPNTLACQIMIYQDTDPQDDPTVITDADALVRQATAQTGSQQWNFNSAKVVHLAKRSDGQLYYTGPVKENPRFNQQGVAYLIQVSEALNFNGEKLGADLECGSVYVDWAIDFQTPQINPSAVASAPIPPPQPCLFKVRLDGNQLYPGQVLKVADGTTATISVGECRMSEILYAEEDPLLYVDGNGIIYGQSLSVDGQTTVLVKSPSSFPENLYAEIVSDKELLLA